jgi:hypothetical protein
MTENILAYITYHAFPRKQFIIKYQSQQQIYIEQISIRDLRGVKHIRRYKETCHYEEEEEEEEEE